MVFGLTLVFRFQMLISPTTPVIQPESNDTQENVYPSPVDDDDQLQILVRLFSMTEKMFSKKEQDCLVITIIIESAIAQ